MKAQIIPVGEETCFLRIERDDGESFDHSLPLLLDELEAVRDAIEEYLKEAK